MVTQQTVALITQGEMTAGVPQPRLSFTRILFVIIFFLLTSDAPTLLAGLPVATGRMLAAGLCLLSPVFLMLRGQRRFGLVTWKDLMPAITLGWMFVGSFLSNMIVYKYSLSSWLFNFYTVLPVLCYYMWWSLGVTVRELCIAIIIVGLFACGIVISDQFFRFPQLNELVRYSAFSDRNTQRRIVLLKNETVLSLFFMLVMLFNIRSVRQLPTALFVLVAISAPAFVVLVIFESRMAILALGMAILAYVFSFRSSVERKVIIVMLSLFITAIAGVFIFDKYIAPVFQLGFEEYSSAYNVDIRFESANYWIDRFKETYGVGVGVMTLNPSVYNIQSAVVSKSYMLADMGVFGALFQFGIPGIAITILLTLYMVYQLFLIGTRSRHESAQYILASACLVVAFELQPIPVNFFTTTTSIPLGWTLWYMMRRAAWDGRAVPVRVGV